MRNGSDRLAVRRERDTEMMTTDFDPEAAFWKRIEEQPGDPLPRLLFADWCDENDKPVMATLQRWLAATGRWPLRLDGRHVWLTHGWRDVAALPTHGPHAVPYNLFIEIRGEENYLHADGWEFFSFPCQRTSEEALADAWRRARRWRQLLYRFIPRYDPVPRVGTSDALPPFRGRMLELSPYQGGVTVFFNLLAMGLGVVLIWGVLTDNFDTFLKILGCAGGFFAFCVIFVVIQKRSFRF